MHGYHELGHKSRECHNYNPTLILSTRHLVVRLANDELVIAKGHARLHVFTMNFVCNSYCNKVIFVECIDLILE